MSGGGEPKGKYSGLASDARGHSSWFLTRTNKEHQGTMEHPFMKTIYAKTFDPAAYAFYLSGQLAIFEELERHCDRCHTEVPIVTVFDKNLNRASALASDVRFWSRASGKEPPATPSPAVAAYLGRLRRDAADPWLLLCHHFLQYNAVLSGGQFLGKMVAEQATASGLAPEGAAGESAGAAFYNFVPESQRTHERVQRYLEDLDTLTIHATLRDRMLECMRDIYRLLLATFDEAFQLAPIEGVSYEASKATSEATSSVTGTKKQPPPPLEPGSRKFSLHELQEHSEGDRLLTSVLGRVYDVTAGRDLFGKGGPYAMFAGRDGTFNLAVMSLKKPTLDKFEYELDADDKECLADWLAYFDNRYGRPLGMLADRQHPLSIKDLPRATKIPFSGSTGAGQDAQSTSGTSGAPPASKL